MFRGDFFLRRPGMVAGQQDREGFLVHARPHQAATGKRQCHDNGIQLAVFQLAAQHMGVIFFDKQRHFRGGFAHPGHHGREQIGRDGKDRSDPQR